MPGLRSKKACAKKKMIVKIHKTGGRVILAVCDSNLIGKKFEDGKLQLDLTSEFYKGDKLDPARTLELMKIANIVHLVGKKSVEIGIKAKIIDKKKIIKIKGIPHAEAVFEG